MDRGLLGDSCGALIRNGGGNSLNHNEFHDAVLLTGGSLSALYGTCFVSRLLEGRWLGHWVARCGKDSFYIMGLHFLGFKIGTLLLSLIGVDRPLAQLTAPAEGSWLLFVYYTLMGVVFPLAFMALFRRTISLIRRP